MEHYQCVNIYIPETSSVRNVDILTFFSTVIPFPIIETEDYLLQSVDNILGILNKPKTQLPFLTYGESKTRAIKSIANLLQRVIPRARTISHPYSWSYTNSFTNTNTPFNCPWASPCSRTNPDNFWPQSALLWALRKFIGCPWNPPGGGLIHP